MRLTTSGLIGIHVDMDVRRRLQTLDTGSCSPPAVAGHTHSLRTWYTSTTVTRFAVYYRNSAGALRAGATAISFGLNLFRNGPLITYDYAMYDTIGAPSL